MHRAYAAALLALSMLATLAIGQSATATFTANVNVFCPYNILINTQASYPILGNVASTFTVQGLSSFCSDPSATGQLQIIDNANSAVAYSNEVDVGPINTVATTYNFQFPTSELVNAVYNAQISLTSGPYTNSITSSFQMLNAPSLDITGFSGDSSPSKGALQTFTASITNNGQYATSPITVDLSVSGPESATSNTVVSALSPYQTENVIFQLSGVTDFSGSYTASIVANTIFNSVEISSNTETFGYSVPGNTGGGSGPTSSPTPTGPSIVQLPQLSIISAPIFTSLTTGSSAVYSMTFQSTSQSTEIVNFSVGNVNFGAASFSPVLHPSTATSGIRKQQSFVQLAAAAAQDPALVTLSTKSLVLGPGQQSTINLFFNAPQNLTPGTYVVPLNITVSAANKTNSQVQFLTFSVQSNSGQYPNIQPQVSLTNNTHTASGVIKITSPYNSSTSNFTLQTRIPLGVATSASQITAYGAPATVTSNGAYYVITWNIGYLPVGQQIYAYYTIENPQNQALLQRVNTVFVVPQAPAPQSVLRVLNINIPTFYTNYTNEIAASVLYTGITQSQITFVLTGPPGTLISGSTQQISASSNQQVSARFKVTTPSTPGTELLGLTISQGNSTQSYSLPVVVLPAAAASPASAGQHPGISINVQMKDIAIAAGAAAALALLVYAAVYIRSQGPGRPRYRKDRSEQLIRIREQIKRSDQVE
ncbi:MAG: hypothetical protein KGH66_01065 [Candidatus Micrarchaeota archaeon]|nr:hypothetical protein [Candidatus Micrarchaeota archaeon]